LKLAKGEGKRAVLVRERLYIDGNRFIQTDNGNRRSINPS